MASIYIETFGCQMNEADSQYIAQRAEAAGYTLATKAEEANVLILNTCTVRDNAERRAYGRMGHFKVLKEADPNLRMIVTGCLAEQDRDRMQRRAPHIDAVFGTKELALLADTLEAWRPEFEETELAQERALLLPLGGAADCITDAFTSLRGFVTVQRGCSYYCTFCIVPHVRGRFDHRPTSEILAEVRERVAAGAREVMLVGQTVNAHKDPATGADFGDLVRAAAATPGLERLAFISPHPKDFTEKIVRDLADLPALNPRIHLPLQSGSDSILRRMNRKYTLAEFAARVEWIHRYLPGWAITSDVIVGFPGETGEDFERTLEFVETGVFANVYSYIYSPRRGTPAANWEPVPNDVVHARFDRLAAAQNRASRAYHDRKIGSVVRCLIQGPSRKDPAKLAAKTLDNVTVIAPMPPDYDDVLYAREPWLDVEVASAHVWGCSGTIRRRAERCAGVGIRVAPPVLDLLAV
ncbi:MAG TPA: tRNA (N6-isopentenyl adenosine(37)-C2)-methylthiotransferase MiaB [Candidatus Baltobacteraceae bacterium]